MFKSLTIPNIQHSIYKFGIGSKYTRTQIESEKEDERAGREIKTASKNLTRAGE